MSVITLDMIRAFAAFMGTSLEDGTQFPGVVGSLEAWEQGVGELKSDLVDSDENREVFAPLVAAYSAAVAAKGEEVKTEDSGEQTV